DDIGIARDAGRARANEALLRAPIFRIKIRLELQRTPIIAAIRRSRDPALHPLLEGHPLGAIPGLLLRFSTHLIHVNLHFTLLTGKDASRGLPVGRSLGKRTSGFEAEVSRDRSRRGKDLRLQWSIQFRFAREERDHGNIDRRHDVARHVSDWGGDASNAWLVA